LNGKTIMKGKLLFLLGLGVGYVFGTRAGRKRYEQIKAAAQNIWESEPVQWSVSQVQDAVGDVAEEAITAAKKVIHQVTGEKPAAKKKPAAKPAAKPATRKEPATRKTPAQPTTEK
jgi:hypothetical protein